MLDLSGKSILITGGTGSFGKMFTKLILERYPNVKRLVILSRDEQKHFQMAQEFTESEYPQIRYFIGDVRDEKRLETAFEDIDIVIHAAAMKHVHLAEYNPMECVKTNINGAENVINAALKTGVNSVIALSTDKAAAPINLYGATKLASDKLFIAANNIRGKRDIRFSVVRYGNVMGSNGSVMPFFLNKKNKGESFLPITDDKMTRFNISLQDGCEMVFYAIEKAWGGEVFVPKIPSYKIPDVATAIAPELEQRIVGIRPGEKLHEEMITSSDSYNTVDLGKYYAILPQKSPYSKYSKENYKLEFNAVNVPEGFSYDSGNNTEWESIESLRELVKKIPYGRQNIDQNDIDAVVSALQSDYLTQGPRVKEFESKFAQYVGAKYAVAVNNATSGLHLSVLALNLSKGDRVITTPITFAASANCVRYAGGEVWFADIDPNTYLLDISSVKELIESKPKGFFKGIIPVDFAGLPVNMEEFMEIMQTLEFFLFTL